MNRYLPHHLPPLLAVQLIPMDTLFALLVVLLVVFFAHSGGLAAISHSLAKEDRVCSSGELRDRFATCCDVAVPFFYLAGEFSSLRGVFHAHLTTARH